MATATAQQSDNIPVVVPFEANLPFAGRVDSNDDSYNSAEGIDDKVPHRFGQAGGLHETVALAAAERHYYNISRGFSSDPGYAQLVKSRLADNDQFDRLNPIRNQYIVLLNSDTVSALDSAAAESYVRRGQDNNTVRAMAAEAARDGAQVIRIYDTLNGYAVQAPDDPRFIERLRNDPRIAHIEADQRVYALNHMQSIPSGINRIDGELSNTRSGDGAGSVNVDVAVLDSGIDLTHPDLNVYRSKTFVSGTTSAKDDSGHGTFVAGIIGAKDDHAGVVGVAPGARLWAVKVLDRSGSGLISDIIAGLDYIVKNAKEIDAANLSFGCECSSPALDSAINKAVSAGITFAVAAGNSAKNANSFAPANNPNVIAVSAIADSDGKCGAKGPATSFGADDALASFSNYGATVSIAAPGVGILSTSMNGGYAKMSGTSAAAPHVAGAAALYEAASPSSSPSQVKSGIIANAVKSSVATCDGNGLGYFTGDKDSSREPLLYLKGMGPHGDGGSNPPPINSVPSADSKALSTNTNTPIDITLSGNDPEKDPLTFSIIDLPKNGQLSSVASDTIRYRPNTGFVGQDTFTYVARDNKGATSPGKATISLTVTQAALCEILAPTSATANGNDGNVPSNVLDNNLNTRWSNLGTGSWIQLDLGSKKSICSVDIAWYLGNQRQYNFIISASDDGTTFTQKHSGASSGTTTSPEKYTLPAATEGRYVRITVNGNTQNQWASITEIAAYGDPINTGTVKGTLYHKWQASPSSSNSWSIWKDKGGGGRGDPVVAQNSDGRLEVFTVSLVDNQLYHKWQTQAGNSESMPSAWTNLGSGITIRGDPIVAKNSDGRLEIFAVSSANNQLYHKWQTSPSSSNSWSLWQSLGSDVTIRGDPMVAKNSDGRLEIFAVSSANNQLYHKWQTTAGNSESWTAGWTNLGSGITIRGDPIVAKNSDGRLEIFAVSSANNQLYHKWQASPSSSNSWSVWKDIGGGGRGDPVVAQNKDGRLEVFTVSLVNNQLYHQWQTKAGDSQSWNGWRNLGSAIAIKGDPMVAKNHDGRLEVLVVNAANNQLYHKWQTSPSSSNSWSVWHNIGSAITIRGDPIVAKNSDGRLEIFAVSAENNQLYHKWQTSPGSSNSWSVWQNIGSAITIRGDPVIASNSDGRLEVFAVNPGSSTRSGGGDAGQNDKFGIKKIYGSKPGGEQWFMNMANPTNDPRFYSGGVTLTKNTDGYSYKIKSTSVRLQAYTSSGYHPDQIATLNQQQLAAKGYMQSPNDWKNVEITGYFKVNSYTSSTTNGAAHIELHSRGGTHTSSKPCEGTAYHSNLYQTGRSKFEKELEHTAGYASNNPEKPGATSTLQGRGWIGTKAAFYTSPIDGTVKVEQWIDDTTDNVISPGNGWHKLLEFRDTGNNWSAPENNCGGTLSQIISWGGPSMFFRWDNMDDMDIKDLSVREITPPSI